MEIQVKYQFTIGCQQGLCSDIVFWPVCSDLDGGQHQNQDPTDFFLISKIDVPTIVDCQPFAGSWHAETSQNIHLQLLQIQYGTQQKNVGTNLQTQIGQNNTSYRLVKQVHISQQKSSYKK